MKGKFIQIHGTSGAGKTTLMRRILSKLDQGCDGRSLKYIEHEWVDKKSNKPKKKIFQLGERFHHFEIGDLDAFVAGSYSATCGGLDSLSAPGIADTFYPKLKEIADNNCHVLMEGLIQMSMGRALDLVTTGYEVHAFFLDTPLVECLRRIDERRATAGKGPLENHENTVTKFNDKPRVYGKLQTGGVSCYICDADEAFRHIMELLRAH